MMRNYIVALLVIIAVTIVVLVTILPTTTKRRANVVATAFATLQSKSTDASATEVSRVPVRRQPSVVAATRLLLPHQTSTNNEQHAVDEQQRAVEEAQRKIDHHQRQIESKRELDREQHKLKQQRELEWRQREMEHQREVEHRRVMLERELKRQHESDQQHELERRQQHEEQERSHKPVTESRGDVTVDVKAAAESTISEEQAEAIEPVQVPAVASAEAIVPMQPQVALHSKLPPTSSNAKIATFDSSMSSKRAAATLRTLSMKPTRKMYEDDVYAIGYVNLEALLRFKTSLMSRLKCTSDPLTVTIENTDIEPTSTNKYRTLFAERAKELNNTLESFWYRYGLVTSDKRWQRYLEERKTTGVPPVRRESILDSMLPQITNLYVNLLDCSEPLGLMMFISLVALAMNEQFNGKFAFVRDSIDPYVIGARFRMLQYYASVDPSDPSYSSSGGGSGGGGGGGDDQMYISSWSSRDRNIAARNTPDPSTEQRVLSTLITCTTSKLKRTGPGLATANPIHLALVSRLGEGWRPVLPAVKSTGATLARLTTSSGTCYDLPHEERIVRLTTYDDMAFSNAAKGLGYVNHILIEDTTSGGGASVFLVDGTRLSFFATPEKAVNGSNDTGRENNTDDCIFSVYRIPSFVSVIQREKVSVTPSYVRHEGESSARSLAWFGVRYRVRVAIRQEQTIILHVTIYHAPEIGNRAAEVEIDDVGNVSIRIVGVAGVIEKRRIVVALQQTHLDPVRDSIESSWLHVEPTGVQDDSFALHIDSHRLNIRLFVDNAIMSTTA